MSANARERLEEWITRKAQRILMMLPMRMAVGVAAALCIIAWSATLLYWGVLQDPVPVLDIVTKLLRPGPFKPGDFVVFERTFCVQYEPVPHSALRWITNDFKIELANQEIALGTGCGEFRGAFVVPAASLPGPHQYHYKVYYQINPIRRRGFEWPPINFDVISKEENSK